MSLPPAYRNPQKSTPPSTMSNHLVVALIQLHCTFEHVKEMNNTREQPVVAPKRGHELSFRNVPCRMAPSNTKPTSEDQQCSSFVTAESPQNCLRHLLLFIVEESCQNCHPLRQYNVLRHSTAQQLQSDQDWFWPALLSRSVHLDPFSTSFISKPSSATIPIQHLDCPFSTPHLLKSAYQSPTIPP